jgi:hypothetical protein
MWAYGLRSQARAPGRRRQDVRNHVHGKQAGRLRAGKGGSAGVLQTPAHIAGRQGAGVRGRRSRCRRRQRLPRSCVAAWPLRAGRLRSRCFTRWEGAVVTQQSSRCRPPAAGGRRQAGAEGQPGASSASSQGQQPAAAAAQQLRPRLRRRARAPAASTAEGEW